MPAIVYNASYTGLSIIQELGSRGVRCVAMDSVPAVGAFSKFSEYRRCVDPLRDEARFAERLLHICRSLPEPPVLFPTNDQWVAATAKYRDVLENVARPCVADYEVVRLLLDKRVFYALGEARGYMTPRTWTFESDVPIDELPFPLVVKPSFRKLLERRNAMRVARELLRLRMTVLESREAFQSFIRREKRYLGDLLLQEFVAGSSDAMFTVGIYADRQSKIRGMFTGRKVRGYPAAYGDNVVGEVHRVPEHVRRNTVRITKELGLTGIAEFEYKRDASTGAFRLIEINPRAWSWIGITPACGVNLPLMAYQDMRGDPVEYAESALPDGSVKYVKLLQDGFNSLLRYRKTHPPWKKNWRGWRESIRAEKTVVAEMHQGDWPAALASVPYTLLKIATGR